MNPTVLLGPPPVPHTDNAGSTHSPGDPCLTETNLSTGAGSEAQVLGSAMEPGSTLLPEIEACPWNQAQYALACVYVCVHIRMRPDMRMPDVA